MLWQRNCGPAQRSDPDICGRAPDISLRTIKTLHTAVWGFFAGCILAIPCFAWRRHFETAWVLIAIVTIEVAVLAANRMRCPLTSVAARYTDDRRDNFDIYLPLWLARHNKLIFGALFAAGIVYTTVQSVFS
jgi:hypothetical protein